MSDPDTNGYPQATCVGSRLTGRAKLPRLHALERHGLARFTATPTTEETQQVWLSPPKAEPASLHTEAPKVVLPVAVTGAEELAQVNQCETEDTSGHGRPRRRVG